MARRLMRALTARNPGDAIQTDSPGLGRGDSRQVRRIAAIDCASRRTVAMAVRRLGRMTPCDISAHTMRRPPSDPPSRLGYLEPVRALPPARAGA